ncbi:CheR family methyltransferase [Propionivibrio limicola]|uniref:CheR family methyltransferase n=1 Tax=Propionivibrio limicola TaxID=167645 RepID=UPI0012914588|nr:protein-glutamate O-methyltransferase CheR [Propionivibrio limicola]
MNSTVRFDHTAISDAEFIQFQKLIFQIAGINLSDGKKVLLVGRLNQRLRHLGFQTFGQYYRHVTSAENRQERQMMVDLLTTNETYFFREPKHFDFLREVATARRSAASFRVWSAASSSGEEAYSVAMVLADVLGGNAWEVVGTDISERVLQKARIGHYSLERANHIPERLLKKYCLKGTGRHDGTLLVSRELRDRVEFRPSNLMAPEKGLGQFDVIFLRNVMIYFDNETKRKVVSNLLPYLKSDGYFVIGHSESLTGVTDELAPLRPTIYRRPHLCR